MIRSSNKLLEREFKNDLFDKYASEKYFNKIIKFDTSDFLKEVEKVKYIASIPIRNAKTISRRWWFESRMQYCDSLYGKQ